MVFIFNRAVKKGDFVTAPVAKLYSQENTVKPVGNRQLTAAVDLFN